MIASEARLLNEILGRAPSIRVSIGPYLVNGRAPLIELSIGCDEAGYPIEWVGGNEYPTQYRYALCRCGRTKRAPFCDGEHTRSGFVGTETARRVPYLEQAKRRSGPTLDLTDAPDLCASARFCMRAGGTWDLVLRSGKPENRLLAIDQAANCPAGRLVVWEKDGRPIEPSFEPSIVAVQDPSLGISGPLWVRGGIPVVSADGYVYEARNRVTLCRCGLSQNKPFCDGNHKEHKYSDRGSPRVPKG